MMGSVGHWLLFIALIFELELSSSEWVADLSDEGLYELMTTKNPENHEIVRCKFDIRYVLYIEVRKDWAPLGAKRFIELVTDKHFHGAALFRALDDFIVQFGLAKSTRQRRKWGHSDLNIKDDPKNGIPFTKGILSFAGSGPNTRSHQVFITLGDIVDHLGSAEWEVPFGRVIYGIENLEYIVTKYGDKVKQREIWAKGYQYLREKFPDLSYMDNCRIAKLPEINGKKKEL